MKKLYKKNKAFIWTGLFVFLTMLVLNGLTPMVYDDYTYSASFATGEMITSIKDIFPSLYAHYFTMNGRLILHFFAHLVLFLPGYIFVFTNSIMYVLMGYLVYKHIVGRKRKSPLLYALIFFAMWFFIPAFGDTVLWIDGSCNYLWGAVLICAYLLPYRIYVEENDFFKNKRWILLMFLGGIIMGWCNENTSAAAIMMIVLFMILYKISGQKIPYWSVSGLAGSLIGFFVMIAAPANRRRAEYFDATEQIKDYIIRFKGITETLIEGRYAWLLLLLIFLVTYVVFKHKSWKKMCLPAIYILGFFASMYAMIMSPYFPERAMFGAVMFLFVAFGLLMEKLPAKKDFALTMAILACVFMLFGISYTHAVYDNAVTYVKHSNRLDYIEAQIEKGEKDIGLDYIPRRGERTAWADIMGDPEHWTNQVMANYFGVDSIYTK